MNPVPAMAKTWEELGVLEHEGRLLFPDSIRRKSKEGGIEEVKICIRPLRKHERRAARLEARDWAKREKVDVDKDPDLLDDMDTYCILARAIREPTPPHEQHQMPEWLEQHYDAGSIAQLWDRYSVYEDMVDPRIDAATEDDTWRTILEIGRTRSVLPLTAFAPRLQHLCILSMAGLALTSPTLSLWLESSGSSIVARSR